MYNGGESRMNNFEIWRWIVMTPPTEKEPAKWIVSFPTKEELDKFMTPTYVKAGYTYFPVYKEV